MHPARSLSLIACFCALAATVAYAESPECEPACGAADSVLAVRQCLAAQEKKGDALLAAAFKRLIAKHAAGETGWAVADLKKVQNSWKGYRKDKCSAEGKMQGIGGSAAGLPASICSCEETYRRLKEAGAY